MEHLAAYFKGDWFPPGGDVVGYTGAHFEVVGHPWNSPASAFKITAEDLVAVTCLSVSVPPGAAVRILGPDASAISDLLRDVPTELDLSAAGDDHIDADAPASRLWRLLRSYRGMGPTTTSKLMARKRARLVPIYDDVVRTELGASSSLGHWADMRSLLGTDIDSGRLLHDHLCDLSLKAELDTLVSPLRVFDVLVWMDGRDRWKARKK